MPRNGIFEGLLGFVIRQDRTAMKVTMDTCAFGALVLKDWQGYSAKRLLDIGTGTGILALMAHQVAPHMKIDALESHEQSASQAGENVTGSTIRVLHGRVQEFAVPQNKGIFDAIITNPPFFSSMKRKGGPEKHADISLPTEELLHAVDVLLTPDGRFFVLADARQKQNRIQLQNLARPLGFHTVRRTFFADNPKSKPHVCAIEFQRLDTHLPIFEENICYFREPPQPTIPGLNHRIPTRRFYELMRGFYKENTLQSPNFSSSPSQEESLHHEKEEVHVHQEDGKKNIQMQ
uniref:Methyltransferase small domain-containing protein n=1 Tax=Aureoumbra lagunensis TaxID=44058 RepID=A0A7S3NPP8_9STRA|mmetsp:Transcript_23239/g.30097  ORF Transcript_23239/g.30097 Transcript_23239/m.30097 type:complete len:291 (+) Transcript_23239:189-1061(+)|eukprot:CAMPEP_0197291922 /NCGR_PEP_ID=MMETSP0890-20130614/20149_1 /TAXON_ID=44058 ORGANISM="Aureoumbra lagunensis, Strain CCMP1510" /NCGR_SAMPLE_ID=MMETSP0890 /ASSEMBLY_ACC=CAM_ASM_000533 /LENGTH=290 /DNA_ID=CAMNT_0042765411 /DNA_START=86 /DNA_END=958 /DNA_ORIENTATION=-